MSLATFSLVAVVLLCKVLSLALPLYTLYEECLPDAKHYENPFDFSKVNLTASIKTPSGKSITIDGFYFQKYSRKYENDQEVLAAEGTPTFCVRYAPTEAGSHKMELQLMDPSGKKTYPSTEFYATNQHEGVHSSGAEQLAFSV
eukprot:m.29749 g.29749  ORF g.29749 m.29749 type:complete len:144 (+) comp31223_c0_seq1:19-450(+)